MLGEKKANGVLSQKIEQFNVFVHSWQCHPHRKVGEMLYERALNNS